MSNPLIKNCSECQQELQTLSSDCKDWEVKRKKAIEEVQNKLCNADLRNNRGHREVVEEKLGTYYNWPAGKTMGEAWKCDKCKTGGCWSTNGYGDFFVDGYTCEHAKPSNQEILTENGITVPHKNNVDTEKERERERERERKRERKREREREQIQSQQSQLLSEIMNLEQNPIQNQAELATKKKKLAELEDKQKELTNPLPLTTQITILEKEISELVQKTSRTKAEESLLKSKKQELARLLAEKNKSNTTNNSDKGSKIALYIGLGAVGVLAVFLVFILVWKSKKNRKVTDFRRSKY